MLAGSAEGPAGAGELIPMAGRNGLAAVPVARRPLRVVPETLTFPIEIDGETVELTGYVKGPGTPIEVLIEVDDAIADWEDNNPTDDDGLNLKPRRWLAKRNRADRILRRDLMVKVVHGLTMDQANVLAADDGDWQHILPPLGWWLAPTAAETEDEDTDDPEATAPAEDAPTGADDLPDSTPATQGQTLSA